MLVFVYWGIVLIPIQGAEPRTPAATLHARRTRRAARARRSRSSLSRQCRSVWRTREEVRVFKSKNDDTGRLSWQLLSGRQLYHKNITILLTEVALPRSSRGERRRKAPHVHGTRPLARYGSSPSRTSFHNDSGRLPRDRRSPTGPRLHRHRRRSLAAWPLISTSFDKQTTRSYLPIAQWHPATSRRQQRLNRGPTRLGTCRGARVSRRVRH